MANNNQATNTQKKVCYFSTNNIYYIDYKDTETLKKFTSYYGKIEPASKSNIKRKYQTRLARAIKRARYMALLPYFVL
ncbi:30S ribosomal protein S18 [Patescibacteria group bacterium]|nr:30S ribosomal protein S18 [Patescibacteria group bacterium]